MWCPSPHPETGFLAVSPPTQLPKGEMTMSSWTLEHRGAIALLTYRRPPDNYLDPESLAELGGLFDSFAENTDRVKLVVITGGSDGYFVNHGDLADHPDWFTVGQDGALHSPGLEAYLDAFHRIEELPQPTIAAIDGLASGGGSELALACTMRVGSPRARLRQSEVPAGIIPGGGGTVRLPRLVGPGIAAEVVLSGRAFTAEEAFRVGWLNAVLPGEGFVDHAIEWAQQFVRHSGAALIAANTSLRDSHRLPFRDALARERDIFLRHVAAGDMAPPPPVARPAG
ncbi:enoyl-CoA hydratase/isomerase family protein [Streptomyces sp. NPDC046821]|uniref:enoyl-CoA hydratase/isomerase family protein n=1 Tax=Streptomyces sp. NPDC046821 TaxID=3154702 RepID=UPI0033D02DD2